jgi:hypothetical protein
MNNLSGTDYSKFYSIAFYNLIPCFAWCILGHLPAVRTNQWTAAVHQNANPTHILEHTGRG